MLSARHFHSQAPVFGRDGLVLFIPEKGGDVAPHLGLVLNDQNLLHRLVPKTGSLTHTFVPCPTLLSIRTLPWCSSTQRLTSSRPKPVPARLPTLPPRWKAVNSRS